MSTIYYSLLKKIFSAIRAHTRHFRALHRLTKFQLDHLDHVDRTHDENCKHSCSEFKIFIYDDELKR